MKYRNIILAVVATIVVVILGALAQSYLSTKAYTINFKNITSVTISEETASGQVSASQKITKPGTSIRLNPDKKYSLAYTGAADYANGTMPFDTSKSVVNIDPYYSDTKLGQMLDAELPAIQAGLRSAYPQIDSLYKITRGKLAQWGDWYVTLLEYKGSDYANADSLRLVMRKEKGSWKLKTAPPKPVLNIYNSPGIPRDVLTRANDIIDTKNYNAN